MDSQSEQILLHLIRDQRVAALGTLRAGAPEVSMAPFASAPDCTAFFLHISRLAHHTQNVLQDSRVSLMLAEQDASPVGGRNPQTLARVSIQGDAVLIDQTSPEFDEARSLYLTKFPAAEMNFSLGDFGLYKIEPRTARFVAGFGQIFNLTTKDFKHAGLRPRRGETS
jgi:putative heme iron utilization protein